MAFWTQLKLICWKNFTLRKRQKVRLVIEIIWPLTLFLILMWVRTRELKKYFEECHFEQKAMPSDGFITSLQTYICTLNNTCNSKATEDVQPTAEVLSSSIFSQFLLDLEETVRIHLTPENVGLVTELLTVVLPPLKDNNTDQSTKLLKKRDLLSDVTGALLGKRIQALQLAFNSVDNPLELLAKASTLNGTIQAFRRLLVKYQAKVTAINSMNTTETILQVLCGNAMSLLVSQSSNDSDDFRSRIGARVKYEGIGTETRDEPNEKCEQFLIGFLGTGSFAEMIWQLVKPIINGKVLYYPNTLAVRKLMTRVEKYFINVNKMSLILEGWVYHISPRLKQAFDIDSPFVELLKLVGGQNLTAARLEQIKKQLDGIDGIVKYAMDFLQCYIPDKFEPVENEIDIPSKAAPLLIDNRLWAVIEFVDAEKYKGDSLPPFVKYKIRMNPGRTVPTLQLRNRPPPPSPRRSPLLHLKYLYYGFAQLQDLVERAIIEEQTGKTVQTGMWLQQFPFPCYIQDRFIIAISRSFPMFMVLAWVYAAAMIIRSIVHEKEKRLTEVMRMMGLSNSVHWLGWFINSFVMMWITITVLTIVLKYGRILELSDPIIIFLYLNCFAIATITMSFLVSTFFSHANIAAATGGMVYFLLYLPYAFLIQWEDELTNLARFAVSVLSNVAFGYGCTYFAVVEETGAGVHWDNFAGSDYWPDYNYTLADSMLILLIDSVIYMILVFYIEAVAPGEYGLSKSWYFCLLPSNYWSPKVQDSIDPSVMENTNGNKNAKNFESEPKHLPVGIAIRNLGKTFPGGKVAVDDLNLNMYEGQITSFLGHNGAGKTTTISILTGLYSPTSGTAFINGQDIRTSMVKIRHSLGMCPQHDVLFDLLTVEEHLWFYAKLKGVTDDQLLKKERDQMINDLGLLDKRKAKSATLSGGMKRKLSIAIAFIGGSKTIILDEPTSGVDPHSRRAIWDLLLKYKKGRTILLTTHFMDEADLLGDRIAIIANGKLQCCGTSLFLKKRYGMGYYLTLVKTDMTDPFIQTQLKTFVSRYIPNCKMKEDVGFEITFTLPDTAKNLANFKPLLDGLEANKSTLRITSYGLSDSTLEETFLRVCDEEESAGKETIRPTVDGLVNDNNRWAEEKLLPDTETGMVPLKKIEGIRLNLYQFCALMRKKIFHTIRNWKGILSEIFLPALFVCFAFFVTVLQPPIYEYPAKELHIYFNNMKNYIFFSDFSFVNNNTHNYVDELIVSPHLGVRCMTGEPLDKACMKMEDNISVLASGGPPMDQTFKPCSCEFGTMACPAEAVEVDYPTVLLSTDDYLTNTTGRDVADWILRTHRRYDYDRHGGYFVGQKRKNPGVNWCPIRKILLYLSDNTGTNITGSNIDEACEYQEVIDIVQIWFYNKHSDASVAYLNAINNIILRSYLPASENSREYGISVINHPLEFTARQAWENVAEYGRFTILQAICVVFAMSFVPASFVLFLIGERTSKFKHLQFVSGVKPIVYWTVAFLWDMTVYLFTACLCLLIFLAFDDKGFTSEISFGPTCLLLILYGWATIPLMYPFSFVFTIPSMAFVALSCCNLFIGITSTLAVFMLEVVDDDELRSVGDTLRQVFLIFPHYCLGRGLVDLKTHQLALDALGRYGWVPAQEPMDWDFLGRNLFFMVLVGVVMLILTILIEYEFFMTPRQHLQTDSGADKDAEDEDVAKERHAVLSGAYDSATLRVENIEKVYISWPWNMNIAYFIKKLYPVRKQAELGNPVRAVNRICFGVRAGECFGLLGVNGAGKTTTFKILTGDTPVTSGNAYLMNYSILNEMIKVRQNLGYCPQFDALDPLLTSQEHLRMFATLKGVPPKNIKEVVDWSIQKMGLEQYRHIQSHKYSGGNKRKLSTAIALIGNPPVVFLDEPTTGMDPKARRFLWNCLLSVMRGGQSVILTSHSMEECEALCSRLSIMVAGKFQCIGSVQHLKNRFGGGYILSVHVQDPARMKALMRFLKLEFPTSVVHEKHHNQVQLGLPRENLKLSGVFGRMEEMKTKLGISDYSIMQTSLDQVFLSFVNAQNQPESSTGELSTNETTV